MKKEGGNRKFNTLMNDLKLKREWGFPQKKHYQIVFLGKSMTFSHVVC
jgi:hypothetical protein